MIEWIHPGLILIIGAVFVPLFKGKLKQIYLVALPIASLVACFYTPLGTHGVIDFIGYKLNFGRVDKLSLLFSYAFSAMAVLGMIYALHVKEDSQHMTSLIYAGSGIGVVFAGDFFTLLIFGEAMAFAAATLVWLRRSKTSSGAGFRYLLVHIFGGVCLMAGALIYFTQTGSIAFNSMMPYEGSLAFYLVLLAFLINAAVPPFGAWLPDAYPEATITGVVFMNAYTTKAAVYMLIRGFAGTELLIWMGVIMAIYGVVYAVIENDSRRLLSYHIISQVGFMVTGVGIGTHLALDGSAAHALGNIVFKGLLFMGAGAVLEMTGKSKLSELGGIYKTMPITMVMFVIGGLSITGLPFFTGFVTKSLIVSAAGEEHMAIPYFLLTLASTGTCLSILLKLTYKMFFGHDSGIRTTEPPKNMLVSMGLASIICILIGTFPQALYALLPYPLEYAPYTASHITSALGQISFTALAFFMLVKILKPKNTRNLDTDWFYRKGAKAFMWIVNNPVAKFEYNVVGEAYEFLIQRVIMRVASFFKQVDTYVVDGSANGLGRITIAWSRFMQVVQNGQAQTYALYMGVGLFVTVALVLLLGGY